GGLRTQVRTVVWLPPDAALPCLDPSALASRRRPCFFLQIASAARNASALAPSRLGRAVRPPWLPESPARRDRGLPGNAAIAGCTRLRAALESRRYLDHPWPPDRAMAQPACQ